MKVKVKVEKEVEVKWVAFRVSYDADDIVPDWAGANGGKLDMVIDLETGMVEDWPQGKEGAVHIKAVDQGRYWLRDHEGRDVAEIIEDYVPHGAVPGAYGDYIVFAIDQSGKVKPWSVDLEEDSWFWSAD